jgi:hypothetical protein
MIKLTPGMVVSLVEIEDAFVVRDDVPFYYLVVKIDKRELYHDVTLLCFQSSSLIRESSQCLEKDCNAELQDLYDGFVWRFFC